MFGMTGGLAFRMKIRCEQKQMLSDSSDNAKYTGWGARIRTWEWRNQNPLPYHLATPQQVPESRTEPSSHAAAGP